jgi:hypothetical protein
MEIKGEKEERAFYRIAALLANSLQARHDYEGALRVSIPALGKMKKSAVNIQIIFLI